VQHWTIWGWVSVLAPALIACAIGIVLWQRHWQKVAENIERLRQSSVRRLERVRQVCEAIGSGLEGHVSVVMSELCPKSKAEWSNEAIDPSSPEAWMRGLVRLNSNKLGIRLLPRENWRIQRQQRVFFGESRDEHMWVPVYYDTCLGVVVDSTVISEAPSEDMLRLSPRTSTEWIAVHLEYRFGKKWRSSAVNDQS